MRTPGTNNSPGAALNRGSFIILAIAFAAWFLPPLRGQEKTGADPEAPGGAVRQKVKEVVAAFFNRALSGDTGDAAKLAVDPEIGLDDAKSVNELLVEAEERIEIVKVLISADEDRAFAISKPVTLPEPQPDGQATGVFAITLVKSKKLTRRGWLIRDIDFESPEEAQADLERFLKLPGKPKKE